MKRKVLLTFPQTLLGEPVLFKVGQEFQVIPNIKGASVSEAIGLVVVELEGDQENIEKTIEYLKGREVKVEFMEGDK